MRKIKIVVAIIGILMIAAMVSAYKQGSRTMASKEMSDPLSAISYLIEEGNKEDNREAFKVMTEKYRYIALNNENMWHLDFQGVKISDVTEVKDEELIDTYEKIDRFKTKDVEEVKIYTATQIHENSPDNYKQIRYFAVVRLKNSIGWLVDNIGYGHELNINSNLK